jgi:hypothetical protein
VRAIRQGQAGERTGVSQGDGARSEPGRLFCEEHPVRAGGKCHDAKIVGLGCQDIDGLTTDRSGRAEKRDADRRTVPCPTAVSG